VNVEERGHKEGIVEKICNSEKRQSLFKWLNDREDGMC